MVGLCHLVTHISVSLFLTVSDSRTVEMGVDFPMTLTQFQHSAQTVVQKSDYHYQV